MRTLAVAVAALVSLSVATPAAAQPPIHGKHKGWDYAFQCVEPRFDPDRPWVVLCDRWVMVRVNKHGRVIK